MEVLIEKMDHQGRGIAHIDNKICFVSNALPGEKVKINITKQTKKYYLAQSEVIANESKKRIKPICPYFNECGGCHLMMMNYEDTLIYKKNKIIEIFNKYAGLKIDPNIINASNLYYRNKIELKACNNVIGFYEENSNKIVNIKKCLITNNAINDILPKLKLENGHITIKANDKNELLLIFNTCDSVNIDLLKDKNVKGIIVNDKIIYGEGFLVYEINKYKYVVSYNSFFQINNDINELIGKKLQSIDFSKDILVDLYCGVSSLSLSLNAKRIIGIEVVENSIKNAQENAKINKKNNIEYICDDAQAIKNISHIDSLIVDPPRNGLSEKVINTILEKKIKRIIYISCDSMTLSRDIKLLKNYYELVEITLFDMFPYTHHVESLCILSLL